MERVEIGSQRERCEARNKTANRAKQKNENWRAKKGDKKEEKKNDKSRIMQLVTTRCDRSGLNVYSKSVIFTRQSSPNFQIVLILCKYDPNHCKRNITATNQ